MLMSFNIRYKEGAHTFSHKPHSVSYLHKKPRVSWTVYARWMQLVDDLKCLLQKYACFFYRQLTFARQHIYLVGTSQHKVSPKETT